MIRVNKKQIRFKQKLILIEACLYHNHLPVEDIAELVGTSKQLLTKVLIEWLKNDHHVCIESRMNK